MTNLISNTDENDSKKTSKAWQLKNIYNACNKAKNKMMAQKINIDVHFYCKYFFNYLLHFIICVSDTSVYNGIIKSNNKKCFVL